MPSAFPEHTLNAAEASLLVFCLAVAGLLPPLSDRVSDYPVLVVLIAVVIASSLVLHLTFVGLLARAMGRKATRFVVGALLTLPIGSIVGLVLLEWHRKVASAAGSAPREA